MSLFRNRDISTLVIKLITIILVCSVAAVVLGALIEMMLVMGILFSVILLLYAHQQNKKLKKLNETLERVNSGDYSIEIEDNEEGELSILKSEIYKVILMLREQNELLKEEKKYLSDSLADISHQLKTPLTSMLVMADLLNSGNVSPEDGREFTRQIKAQLERMQWLVSSLLKLSKLDAEAVTFNIQGTRPQMLADKFTAPLLIPMEIKNQSLEIHVDDQPFYCDMNWTSEALLNIMKNCVEHTPAGGSINVSISTNALFTEIIIEDSGKGIAKEDLPYIFNRFYKGKDSTEESIGIGLAMAKSIIESQSGSIEAGIGKNKGARFTIRFPKLK